VLRSTLEASDLSKSVTWIDPGLGYRNYFGELRKTAEGGSPIIFSFSAAESETPLIETRLQYLFNLSEDVVGFVFPLGKIGENGLLNDAIHFCSAAPNRRLTALREISPFFASSQVGLIYNASNQSIPASLDRISQQYDGNFQFLRLVQESIEDAVARKSGRAEPRLSGEGLAKRMTARRVSPGEWSLLPDSPAIKVLKKLIPNAVKHSVKSKLVK
jgi:hypothetical protein